MRTTRTGSVRRLVSHQPTDRPFLGEKGEYKNMGRLQLTDIIALAKQGYKPGDIKELLAIEIPENTPEPVQEEQPQPETVQAEITQQITEPETSTPAKATGQTGNDDVEELKATIKELQQANIHQDISGNVKDPQENLNELVRAYM